jgi:hypothetical protein
MSAQSKKRNCSKLNKMLKEFYEKLQSHNDVTWRAWARERLERLERMEALRP